jgi:hypothetical protein
MSTHRHAYDPIFRREQGSNRRQTESRVSTCRQDAMKPLRHDDMLSIFCFCSASRLLVSGYSDPPRKPLALSDRLAAAVGHYSLQSCRRALRAIAWPYTRLVAHLGNGRWWDADTGYWRSDRGQRVAVRGRLDMASVRTTYVVLACAHLDHDPGHNLPNNLAALCQRCHMLHDAAEHRWQRWWNVFRLCALRDLYEDPRFTRQRLARHPSST